MKIFQFVIIGSLDRNRQEAVAFNRRSRLTSLRDVSSLVDESKMRTQAKCVDDTSNFQLFTYSLTFIEIILSFSFEFIILI